MSILIILVAATVGIMIARKLVLRSEEKPDEEARQAVAAVEKQVNEEIALAVAVAKLKSKPKTKTKKAIKKKKK